MCAASSLRRFGYPKKVQRDFPRNKGSRWWQPCFSGSLLLPITFGGIELGEEEKKQGVLNSSWAGGFPRRSRESRLAKESPLHIRKRKLLQHGAGGNLQLRPQYAWPGDQGLEHTLF